jgi:hypothetical protein
MGYTANAQTLGTVLNNNCFSYTIASVGQPGILAIQYTRPLLISAQDFVLHQATIQNYRHRTVTKPLFPERLI